MVTGRTVGIIIVCGIVVGIAFISLCCILCYCLRKDSNPKKKKVKRRTTILSSLTSMTDDKGKTYLAIGDHSRDHTQKGVSMQPFGANASDIDISKTPKRRQSIPQKVAMILPQSIFPEYYKLNYHKKRRRKYLKEYTMDEISEHDTMESCWIVVNNLVLDVTKFMQYHPAGINSILNKGGIVCDKDYEFHSKEAKEIFWKFVIGRVEGSHSGNYCIIQ